MKFNFCKLNDFNAYHLMPLSVVQSIAMLNYHYDIIIIIIILLFQDVIRQSLIRGNLPLAHAYLINKSINSGRGDHTFGDDTDVTLKGIISVGLGFVMEELSVKNLEQAISILCQMVRELFAKE